MFDFIKSNYKTILIALLGFLFLILWASWREAEKSTNLVTNFEECVFNYGIALINPETCLTPKGEFFIKYSLDDHRVKINLDKEWPVKEGRLLVSGKITGQWFFEASFVIKLWDKSGREISRGLAEAKEDWMTSELIPFEATLEILSSWQGEEAILVLVKDNPSGLPEHEDALALPIKLNHVFDDIGR